LYKRTHRGVGQSRSAVAALDVRLAEVICVLIPKQASTWDDTKNPNQVFVVPVGY
jgi:hypothetical protein